jgi:hypothetical protein
MKIPQNQTTLNVLPKAPTTVTMQRAAVQPTLDQSLWVVIRNTTKAISYESYAEFIEPIMNGHDPKNSAYRQTNSTRTLPFPDSDPYRRLKVATEVFLMGHAGVVLHPTQPVAPGVDLDHADLDFASDVAGSTEESLRLLSPPGNRGPQWQAYLQSVGTAQTLPYLHDIVDLKLGDLTVQPGNRYGSARGGYGILRQKLTRPLLIELIWNYWHEEGMLVQAMNAIAWRFQNRGGSGGKGRDPLAGLEIDPLRGLNNLLWGFVQDEQNRLTIPRRAYEYDHEYGIRLLGRAVPTIKGADSRSRFLEGFHNLLQLCAVFYKEDDDTTVVADGFPVLNALREVHLQLSQGASNQYGDLPWTARMEFLMQEWLLARPEMREFLPRRVMVDYPEPWMDSVETMKTLQGWSDTSILHFRDLGVFGEGILLSVRFGAWTSEIHPEAAANWARYWRPEIQGYLHAYRAATGADLTSHADGTMPSVLLSRRMPAAMKTALQRQLTR